ncbi:CAP domain-containing protein [Streptomyces sp. CAU 1734]|uniref:CAP domain-containing protein n=1 Tax=Streptomyces sp. CAU 1734 TaxID=3140360 RepID=UPI00326154AD
MAVGTVAVASGLLPGGKTFVVGGESSPGGQLRSGGSATLQTQGESSGRPAGDTPSTAPAPAHAPSKTPSPKPSVKQEKTKPAESTPERTARSTPSAEERTKAPAREKPREADRTKERPTPPAGGPSSPTEKGAEAQVLALVNQERAKVGCAPVRFDSSLAALAGAFSSDMAARGFFSHTDPDGDSPWDRAEQAGVKNLGGENIARGQMDAAAVMNSWMNSEGHRANILNCDYKTLGVGVDMSAGGPWWTQNFGF